ncbi:hypothetical protein [Streptomyces mangrovisoli]|uniref:Peptidoglycan binding domain-containing protein n=1 Tax=Streptomyces mangrovisoli TaxID=1428628 RepID=A0A1J4NRC4_9ACTN|nr:hypothetical protein [Streptomyces mangrovisoli]OIJ64864.1 hypothetical protein WN71_026585 [Streptomyces mangrovisoli]
MSRETDTPSSGPNGRGGAAYPSGTPPYGIPKVSEEAAEAGRAAAQPEERKTETTLTTRIRINIPGSRPIPPVVVRKPVTDAEGSGDARNAGSPQNAKPAEAPVAAAPAPAEPAPAAEEKPPSDWFAPRKGGAPKAGPGGGTNGAGLPGGAAAGTGTPSSAAGTPASGTPAFGTPAPGGARPGASGAQGGTRPGGTNGAGLPGGATGGPVAPGHGGGTGSFDVTEALAAGPLGGGPRRGQDGGGASRDELPYFSEDGADPYDFTSGGAGGQGGPGGFSGSGGPGGRGGAQGGPAGPTSGPVTGDGPRIPPAAGPGATGSTTGTANVGRRGPGLSDDTAVLTPQFPSSEPGGAGYGAPTGQVSGHTVTSGIPVVPPGNGSPFGPGGRAGAPGAHTPPKLPDSPQPSPAAPAAAKAAAKAAPKKKGRSKLVLLGGLVVVAGIGAYGAGLLMNHSDVPKGTTVLGVDIGGGTRDDAVRKLDEAFGKQVDKPLKLSVDGSTVTLKPDQAGLQFDFQSTVSAAAESDYNPVSVIGSLFGQERAVDPVMPVDEEKLQAALESTGGGSGSVTEGTIDFKSGKAVAVYGKAGKAVDASAAAAKVEQAFRTQVETGDTTPVQVPGTTKQPTVSKAEVDREMKDFAKPAMSGNVTVQTDAAHSIAFSPQNSLWKFLRVKAVGGKLTDAPDTQALKALYGQTFDGVLITRANGKKTAVTPEDVYVALRTALTSTSNRVAVIDTDPS